MNSPLVTVLMPVFNAAHHLQEALDSVLGQTYKEFEFLIIDDGSTDDSFRVLSSIRDSRINLLKNDRNRGLIYTLNRGLEQASGRYLVRMDADDIALPTRIEKQLRFMQRNPMVGISGTWSRTFGAVKAEWETRFSRNHEDIVAHMIFNTALSHPTAMMDLDLMKCHGLHYSERAQHAEDYDLWVRASQHFRLANVPEVLLRYRVHERQVSQQFSNAQRCTADGVRLQLLKRLGVDVKPADSFLHSQLSNYMWRQDRVFFDESRCWLRQVSREIDQNSPLYSTAVRKAFRGRLQELHRYVYNGQRRIERVKLYFMI